MATWYAMEICKTLGVQESVLEGDAKGVIQALQHAGDWRGRYCMLV